MPVGTIAQSEYQLQQGAGMLAPVVLEIQYRPAAIDGRIGAEQQGALHALHVGLDQSAGGQVQPVDRAHRDGVAVTDRHQCGLAEIAGKAGVERRDCPPTGFRAERRTMG